MSPDPFEDPLHLGSKLVPQPRTLIVVVVDGFDELLLSTGQYQDFHRRLTLAKTSSAEEAVSLPPSYALIRNSISSDHAESIRRSADGSKLWKRRSISSARSTGGKPRAVSSIRSAVAVIYLSSSWSTSFGKLPYDAPLGKVLPSGERVDQRGRSRGPLHLGLCPGSSSYSQSYLIPSPLTWLLGAGIVADRFFPTGARDPRGSITSTIASTIASTIPARRLKE